MADQTDRKRLTFDPTINAGHLLTFAGFILSMMVGWSVLDKRVVVLEEARKTQAQVDQHQDAMQRSNADSVRESLQEIKQGVRELNARFERKESRP
jgi:hypothetical protein